MIASYITFLLCVMGVALLFQNNKCSFFGALFVVAAVLVHEWAFSNFSGLFYYLSAAFFDFTVLVLLSRISRQNWMILNLQKICLVSMFVNLSGWLLWLSYEPPFLYDLSFALIYSWTAIILIKGAGDGMADNTGNRRRTGVYLINVARNKNLHGIEG